MQAQAIVQRLLWKDYRTLRVVWLACALGTIGLMVLLRATFQFQYQASNLPTGPFWALAIWIPPIYLLAAIATMFAGAREEGNLTWLSILSPPAKVLVGSQLVFAMLTALALHVILGVTAAIQTNLDTRQLGLSPGGVILVMMFLIVEATLWAWFWSLQTSKVLQAILYAVISIAFMNVIAGLTWSSVHSRGDALLDISWDNPFGIAGWGRMVVYAALIPICVKLSDRWLDGQPWDWTGLTRWWTARGKSAGLPVTRVEASESWRRVWQRLRWLEWQAMRPWRNAVYVATVLSCLSLLFGTRGSMALAFVLSWIIPIVAGLAAWQGEQHQSQFRMLVYRGASPEAIWWNKLLFWLGFAICGVLFVDVATLVCWELLSAVEHWSDPSMSTRRWPTTWETMRRWYKLESLGESPLNVFSPGVLITLSSMMVTPFVLPFACGHWLKRTVVALGASGAAAFAVIPWFVLVEKYHLPAWVFLAPVPIWLLWLSWRYLPAWWMERTSWRLTHREAVELTAAGMFPVVLLAGAIGYRVWEIPTVQLKYYPADGWLSQPSLAQLAQRQSPGPTWDDVELEVLRLVEANAQNISMTSVPVGGPAVAVDKLVLRDPAEAVKLRNLVLAQQGLPADFQFTDRARLLASSVASPALVRLAIQQLADGESAESILSVQAAVRLDGAVHRNLPNRHLHLYHDLRSLFEPLQQWASHPQQTEETLVQGLRACAQELPYWQMTFEELQRIHAVELSYPDIFWPWEVARYRKLVDLAYVNRWSYLMQVRHGRRQPDVFPSMWVAPHSRQVRDPLWDFRVRDSQPHYQSDGPVGLGAGEIRAIFDLESAFRAHLTVTSLVGYRHVQGELPVSLNPLMDWFRDLEPSSGGDPLRQPGELQHWPTQDPSPLIDLWSGETFRYQPDGFALGSAYSADSVYRKPSVWTVGPTHLGVAVRNGILFQRPEAFFHANARFIEDPPPEEKPPEWLFVIPPQGSESHPVSAVESRGN